MHQFYSPMIGCLVDYNPVYLKSYSNNQKFSYRD